MRIALAIVASVAIITPAAADQALPGKLVGHAIVPAETFFHPPTDAPADLAVSGHQQDCLRIVCVSHNVCRNAIDGRAAVPQRPPPFLLHGAQWPHTIAACRCKTG